MRMREVCIDHLFLKDTEYPIVMLLVHPLTSSSAIARATDSGLEYAGNGQLVSLLHIC